MAVKPENGKAGGCPHPDFMVLHHLSTVSVGSCWLILQYAEVVMVFLSSTGRSLADSYIGKSLIVNLQS